MQTQLNEMSQADMITVFLALQAENAKLKASKGNGSSLSCKVSVKGALSVYGFGRWPVTLYKSQWARLWANREMIEAALAANDHLLASKEQA